MTSLLQYMLIILAVTVGTTSAFYVRLDSKTLIYFSEAEITVNVAEYRQACSRIGNYVAYIDDRSTNEFIFASYSGNEAYMIDYIGPHVDGEFSSIRGRKQGYNNFQNDTAAKSGAFGITYLDFPNNWWKVAPMMGQRKMRYLCYVTNPCIDRCERASCVVNSTTGGYHCEYNATSCSEGVRCGYHGTCIDKADGYSCLCLEHYSGKHCELYDVCWSSPCQHGATCMNRYRITNRFDVTSYYYCQCSDRFRGRDCQYTASSSTCYVGTCHNMPCIESIQSTFCAALDRDGAQMCVSSTIAGSWVSYSVFNSTFVNHLSQYLRPYVNIKRSMACGCNDVTSQDCRYDINECASDPCQGRGRCYDRIRGYRCECGHFYFGFNCETFHGDCHPNPCENSGTCVIKSGRTSCSCDTGFEGEFCQDIAQCTSAPCLHGECIDEINKDRYCNCRGTGYTGRFCEVNVDDCYSSPCLRGDCIDEILKYHCNCSDTGYTGKHCETDIDECASNPCVYGHCADKLNRYECDCYSGVSGDHCDIFVCASDPCMNNGTCLFDVREQSYRCVCNSKYAGLHCEIKLVTEFEVRDKMNQKPSATWIYVAICVAGFMALSISCVVILCLCQKVSTRTVPEPYTSMALAPMPNNDGITGENYATLGRLSTYDEIKDEDITHRSADSVTSKYRSSALYDEIGDRNLHIETGNEVLSHQYLTPPSGARQAPDTDRQTDEDDDDDFGPISSHCTNK